MGVMRWPEVHLVMSQGAALCGAALASREMDWVEEIKRESDWHSADVLELEVFKVEVMVSCDAEGTFPSLPGRTCSRRKELWKRCSPAWPRRHWDTVCFETITHEGGYQVAARSWAELQPRTMRAICVCAQKKRANKNAIVYQVVFLSLYVMFLCVRCWASCEKGTKNDERGTQASKTLQSKSLLVPCDADKCGPTLSSSSSGLLVASLARGIENRLLLVVPSRLESWSAVLKKLLPSVKKQPSRAAAFNTSSLENWNSSSFNKTLQS